MRRHITAHRVPEAGDRDQLWADTEFFHPAKRRKRSHLRKMCEPAGAVASQVTAVTGAMPWTTGARWRANSTTGAGANTASAGAELLALEPALELRTQPSKSTYVRGIN